MSIRSYTFIGASNGDGAGWSVSSAGDVDGDGSADFLVGTLDAELGYLLTAADLEAMDGADGASDGFIDLGNVEGHSSSYVFDANGLVDGRAVFMSSAGDVDGDGLADILIGMPRGGATESGTAVLLTASDLAGLDASDGAADSVIDLSEVIGAQGIYQITASGSRDGLGRDISSAGDVDGDGLDDLLIGAPDANGPSTSPTEGVSYLLSAADLNAADAADGAVDGIIDATFIAGQPTSYSFASDGHNYDAGRSLKSLGDIDGDGKVDLLIGSPYDDDAANRAGTTYFVSGNDLAVLDAADGTVDGQINLANVAGQSGSYEFQGVAVAENSGTEVANAGDVNGDGVDDLLIGTENANPSEVTAAYVISGTEFAAADAADGSVDGVIDLSFVAQQAGSYQFNAPTTGTYAGYSVSSAGDIDGDGRADMLIGSTTGVSYVVAGADLDAADAADGTVDGVIDLGNAVGLGNSFQLDAGSGTPGAGFNVSSAGDIDHDGFDDILIGAPGGGTGGVYLLSGADLASADDDGSGQDGIIDLGNVFYDGVVEGSAGADRIDGFYLGDTQLDQVDNRDNSSSTNDDVIRAGAGDDTIIAGVGNDTVDAEDGDDTIIAGAGDDDIDGGTGRDAYVSGDLGASYAFVGANSGDSSGRALASVGDVDGDGLQDYLIGAPSADGGGSSSGEAFLISGAQLEAADAADGTIDRTIDLGNVNDLAGSYQFIGIEGGDIAGRTLASVGDVDGDGLDDFLIGAQDAQGTSTTFVEGGEAYLITAASLTSADAADGSLDGIVDLGNVAGHAGSYQFVGTGPDGGIAVSLSSAGDIDGDGLADFLIGAPEYGSNFGLDEGATYLVTARGLADADAADGSVDGVINTPFIAGQGGSYRIEAGAFDQSLGQSVASLGDLDGDGIDDLLIGAFEIGTSIETGGAYFVSGAEIANLDGADGVTDGVIEAATVVGEPGIIQFIGDTPDPSAGFAVSSAGDVDGDGVVDLLIGSPTDNTGSLVSAGSVHLVSGSDIAAADAADGLVDGRVELSNVAGLGDSYKFLGNTAGVQFGATVSSAGDVDGDGLDDILIGSLVGNQTYLVTAFDLADADAADGSSDGEINLDNVASQSTSYEFVGATSADRAGVEVRAANDVDGDGLGDFWIGASGTDGGRGESYLIAGRDLAAFDALDGSSDGIINLGLVGIIDDTVTVDINDDGDGTVTGTYVTGTDTITSVENFVAGENPDEADTITITDTGTGYTTTDISGLDDTAEGVFMPNDGSPAVAFGPTAGVLLSDVINGIENGPYREGGRFQITGGDEDGQVGNISFENFETINFDVVCFARGTQLATPSGPKCIENLSEGDEVQTLDHGVQEIRWIGSCKLDQSALSHKPKLKPIRIRKGALGNNLPTKDLFVSRQHRVLVRSEIAERMFGQKELLVAAHKLLALDGFDVDESATKVEYFHILFDRHQIVFSNGAPTESLFTGPEALKSVSQEAREEIVEIFPEVLCMDFTPRPARTIPRQGRRILRLAERHKKNKKPILQMIA